jgi:hypothetical protein
MNKTIILIGIAVFWNVHIKAQSPKCDYQCIMYVIDSLKIASVNGLRLVSPPKERWNFNDLSIYERNRIVDYVEVMYEQGFYDLGGKLLVNFYGNNDTNLQNRVAILHLDKAFYSFNKSFTYLGSLSNYSDETKERLKNILEGKMTENDIKARQLRAMQDARRNYSIRIDADVARVIRTDNRNIEEIINHVNDSITSIYAKIEMRRIEKYPPLTSGAILRIGGSKDMRFVPGLEKILETDYHSLVTDDFGWTLEINSVQDAALYALAKLGVQKYLEQVYESEHIGRAYKYLGTKEAFLKYLDRVFIWNKGCFMDTSQRLPDPCAIVVLFEEIMFGRDYLLNIPEDIKFLLSIVYYCYITPRNINITDYDPSKDEANSEYIKIANHVYRWLIDNQDVWEIQQRNTLR